MSCTDSAESLFWAGLGKIWTKIPNLGPGRLFISLFSPAFLTQEVQKAGRSLKPPEENLPAPLAREALHIQEQSETLSKELREVSHNREALLGQLQELREHIQVLQEGQRFTGQLVSNPFLFLFQIYFSGGQANLGTWEEKRELLGRVVWGLASKGWVKSWRWNTFCNQITKGDWEQSFQGLNPGLLHLSAGAPWFACPFSCFLWKRSSAWSHRATSPWPQNQVSGGWGRFACSNKEYWWRSLPTLPSPTVFQGITFTGLRVFWRFLSWKRWSTPLLWSTVFFGV